MHIYVQIQLYPQHIICWLTWVTVRGLTFNITTMHKNDMKARVTTVFQFEKKRKIRNTVNIVVPMVVD